MKEIAGFFYMFASVARHVGLGNLRVVFGTQDEPLYAVWGSNVHFKSLRT
jgi:hypothetical protein